MEPQSEWFDKDYYAVLGVPSTAVLKDIKRAYKDLARKLHPDQNPGDKAAEERFKEVSAAYDVLGDDEKRQAYDEVRRMVKAGVDPRGGGGFAPGGFNFDGDVAGEGFGGLGDFLGGLFGRGGGPSGGQRRPRGGPQRGRDLETELHVAFEDAAHGVTTTVRFTAEAVCSACHGNGAKAGTNPERCDTCHGAGTVAQNQGPFSFSQVCPACAGRGQIVRDPCTTCRGRGVEVRPREVKVRIPAGVENGQRIRVKERGAAGLNGGPSGDLYVVVHVRGDETFGRKGNDLTVRVPVSFPVAALGGEVKVPTLEGDTVTIRIPAGTASGKTLRVPGRGISGASLLVRVDVEIPTKLTDTQRGAIEALATALSEDAPNGDAPPPPASHHKKRRKNDGAA
jgi:molecular chaperone DnaJ